MSIIAIVNADTTMRLEKVKAYLGGNSCIITAEYLPNGSPKLSAVEDAENNGKGHLLVSKTNLNSLI